MIKRVYKFTCAKYGICNLKNRRLKLSTIADLNDPFDLHSINTSDPQIASAARALTDGLFRHIGLLCFSRNWDNLLLWSHYGASHTGVCLGFDIPEHSEASLDVRYQPSLLEIRGPEDLTEALAKRSLCTKHECWSYEQEVRMFANLNDPPDEKHLYWTPFGPDLQLKEVIIGAQCQAEEAKTVCEVLKEYPPNQVECTWAYMRSDAFVLIRNTTTHANAFRSFNAG